MEYPEDYKIAIELVLHEEGGYSNHAADSGGATNYGITERSLLDYCRRRGASLTVPTLTKEDARLFYWLEYWLPLRLAEFPGQSLKNVVLATAVNMGKVPAIRKLQRLVGATPDGKVGPRTLLYLSQFERLREARHALVNDYCQCVEDFYVRLAERRPKDVVFLRGWKKRIRSFRLP